MTTRAKRNQVSRACERCRSIRRACSQFRPCKRCVELGLADQCLGKPGPVRIEWGGAASPVSPASSIHEGPLLSLPSSSSMIHVPSALVDYCTDRFLERLYPTIPILTRDHMAWLKDLTSRGSETAASSTAKMRIEATCLLAAMCSLILLQVENAGDDTTALTRDLPLPDSDPMKYGERLFQETIRVHGSLARTSSPSFELCLLTFFLYACHAALLHHSQAFLFLREATTLWILLRPENEAPRTRILIGRLFWVLLISERSHAIRYRRPVTMQITSDTPTAAGPDEHDLGLDGFWSLVALFSPLDTSFIALLNHEKVSGPPSAATLSELETSINTALRPTSQLRDTQKANLRITQLWLLIILWQLRLRSGLLTEDAPLPSLTFRYPLEVAKDLTLSTRDLPLDSIKVHGVGLTEKLFDIASAVVDVLARVPLTPSAGVVQWVGLGPGEDLKYVRGLITLLPGGTDIYDALLDKHVQQAVPNIDSQRPGVS